MMSRCGDGATEVRIDLCAPVRCRVGGAVGRVRTLVGDGRPVPISMTLVDRLVMSAAFPSGRGVRPTLPASAITRPAA
jgi:hypothetical protein